MAYLDNTGLVRYDGLLKSWVKEDALVKAAGSNTGRNLPERFADVVNIKDFGAKGDGITNDIVAIQNAINYAEFVKKPLYIPAGEFYIPCGTSILIPDSISIIGDGANNSIFKLDDFATNYRRDFIIANSCSNIFIKDVGFVGTWSTENTTRGFAQKSHLLVINNDFGNTYGRLSIDHCTFTQGHFFAVVARCVENVSISCCKVERFCADGFHISSCRNTSIVNNYFKFVCDDSIGCHNYNGDGVNIDLDVPMGDIVVSGNIIEDSQGICCLNGKRVIISNNVITRGSTRGIKVAYPQSISSLEGLSSPLSINVSNNIITDLFKGSVFSEASADGYWLEIGFFDIDTPPSSLYVTYSNGEGEIVQPYDYFLDPSWPQKQKVSTGTWGVVVAGNVCMRTLPKVVSKYSDYGYGERVSRTGVVDPEITLSSFSQSQIVIIGYVNNMIVTDNILGGVSSPITLASYAASHSAGYVSTHKTWDNVTVSHNQIYNVELPSDTMQTAAIKLNGIGTVKIENNIIDGDPFYILPYHNSDGTWNGAYMDKFSAFLVAGGGSHIFTENIIKNVLQVFIGSSYKNHIWVNTILECDPYGIGSLDTNKGIRYIIFPDAMDSKYVIVNCDSNDANFRKIKNVCLSSSQTIPTSGKYIVGYFVKCEASVVVSQYQLLGWKRLTTGDSHVEGVDWMAVYAETNPSRIGTLEGRVAALEASVSA